MLGFFIHYSRVEQHLREFNPYDELTLLDKELQPRVLAILRKPKDTRYDGHILT
ncbi:hypothetical protein L873DRAFT_1820489 [Choiromyces venosus 120613-1]|uniref:Uncharacterized protein n=1 Tax=Choiromyces venosus 120613-1 TaxID=1336337 RepID=A0A3N4IX47_9PEZI|nr:hypothetical protein L873DRAFT_1820489 [Choiromyces venosus 120613-1]